MARFLYIFAAPVPAAFLYLTLSVIDAPLSPAEKRLSVISVLTTALFILFSQSELFLKSIGENNGAKFPVGGPIFHLFFGYFIFMCGWTFWRLQSEYKKASGIRKNQYLYFFVAFALAYCGGAIHFAGQHINDEVFPHDILVFFFTITISYAILRHRLMDFGLFIRIGLAYGITIVFLLIAVAPIILILKNISTPNSAPIGIAAVLITPILFQLIRPTTFFATKLIDKFIFNSPDIQNGIIEITSALDRRKNQPTTINQLADCLQKAWKCTSAGIVKVLDANNETHDVNSRFLIKTLATEKRLFKYGVITEDDLLSLSVSASPGEKGTIQKILMGLRELKAAVAVPLFQDNNFIGFIHLGPKCNGHLFSSEDKKLLAHLSSPISDWINSK